MPSNIIVLETTLLFSFFLFCLNVSLIPPRLQASHRLPQVVGYSSEDQRRVSVHGTVGEFRRTFAFVGNRADRTEVSGNNCELLVSGVEWWEVLSATLRCYYSCYPF